MNHWKTEQDSLRNWHISAGSSSPKIQWVLARYNQDEEKAASIEHTMLSNGNELRFNLLLKTFEIMHKKRK